MIANPANAQTCRCPDAPRSLAGRESRPATARGQSFAGAINWSLRTNYVTIVEAVPTGGLEAGSNAQGSSSLFSETNMGGLESPKDAS